MKSGTSIGRQVSLVIGAGLMVMSSQAGLGQEADELPFSEAQLYFELNHTDGDLGIHGLIDGDAWKSLEIEAPGEQLLMNVWIRGSLRQAGHDGNLFRERRAFVRRIVARGLLQAVPARHSTRSRASRSTTRSWKPRFGCRT